MFELLCQFVSISQLNLQYLLDCVLETFLCFQHSRASDFGLMKIDSKGRVLFFNEKPKGNDLKAMVSLCSTLNFEQKKNKEWFS